MQNSYSLWLLFEIVGKEGDSQIIFK
jgi:hypothetical protein